MVLYRVLILSLLGVAALVLPTIITASSGEKYDSAMCGVVLSRDQIVGNYVLSLSAGTMSSQGHTRPMPAFTSRVTIFAEDGRLNMVSDDGYMNLDLGLPTVQDNLPMLDAIRENWLDIRNHPLPSIEGVERGLGCENGQKLPVFLGEGTVLSDDNKHGPADMNLYIHGYGDGGVFGSGLLIVRWPDLVMRLVVKLNPAP